VVVCVAGATVKVVLIILLDLFGSKPAGIVATTHVNLCVPGVAVQGVCKITFIGKPGGPGYVTIRPLTSDKPMKHPTCTFCGNDTVDQRATRTVLRITEPPACGFGGVIPTDTIAQSVSTIAGGGNVGVTWVTVIMGVMVATNEVGVMVCITNVVGVTVATIIVCVDV
jgi:hypothetical protein